MDVLSARKPTKHHKKAAALPPAYPVNSLLMCWQRTPSKYSSEAGEGGWFKLLQSLVGRASVPRQKPKQRSIATCTVVEFSAIRVRQGGPRLKAGRQAAASCNWPHLAPFWHFMETLLTSLQLVAEGEYVHVKGHWRQQLSDKTVIINYADKSVKNIYIGRKLKAAKFKHKRHKFLVLNLFKKQSRSLKSVRDSKLYKFRIE